MALGSGQRSGARSCGKLGEAHLRPGSCVCKTGVRTGPHPARGADRERRVRAARGGHAGVRPGARGCGPGHELRCGRFSVSPKSFQNMRWDRKETEKAASRRSGSERCGRGRTSAGSGVIPAQGGHGDLRPGHPGSPPAGRGLHRGRSAGIPGALGPRSPQRQEAPRTCPEVCSSHPLSCEILFPERSLGQVSLRKVAGAVCRLVVEPYYSKYVYPAPPRSPGVT